MPTMLPTPALPTSVENLLIHNLHELIKTFRYEIAVSPSASQPTGITAKDRERVDSFLAALRHKQSYIKNYPNLDIVDVKRVYPISAYEELEPIENLDIVQFITQLENLDVALLYSQSARRSVGLHPADGIRLDEALGALEGFLTQYVDQATPLDLPRSSPTVPVTSDGRTLVKPPTGK